MALKKRAYIETTIPSFYFEPRPESEMAARRHWTRRWWAKAVMGGTCEVVTSMAVVEELSRGDFPTREQSLNLIDRVPLLPIESAVAEISRVYIDHRVMPADPVGDSLHLALASFYKCDFLVTWNCRHLANANKFDHIRRVNAMLGLFVPALVTPLELLGDEP